ncbi:hypothetical protein B0H17DRAFT_941506 [Mycena rosella]|uniref:Methyltransferase type 11 domain-containing protein n=1 Tax=Mycena rosella TaxID=1033263 RepID=A0AAD7GEP9_MYCRO|nr:hypothetical protein B0H17DRAFT_941506 [Mycena rosella]
MLNSRGRLDETHEAFSQYFDGQLCLAPLAEELPRKILELGLTPGRAIQSAMQFPDAQVLAVDAAPLPDRIIPANVHFELLDLCAELPFEPGTFDIVHARLVMTHVINGEDALKRAALLVKPGGLLLVEDLDLGSLVETGGPAVRRLASNIIQSWSARGADAELGRKIEAAISSLGYFPHVQACRIDIPLAGNSSDSEAKKKLGTAFKKSLVQASEHVGRCVVAQHITEDMAREQREELDQGNWGAVLDVYFCWARRAL